MPRFELRKYHKNMGHEGEGFACELWMDGALAAHVIDEGGGGPPLYQWASRETASKVLDHVKTLPEKVYPADPKHGINEAFSHPADQESFIWDLVAAHLEDKRTRRAAKTKLLFKLKSDAGTDVAYRTLKAPYSEQAAEFVRKKYGDDLLEIVMEVQVHGEFHAVRIRIRGKRSVWMLVNAWDDLPRQVQRNWKNYRRMQYKVKPLFPCVPPLHDD
jgi:hypothetical protein